MFEPKQNKFICQDYFLVLLYCYTVIAESDKIKKEGFTLLYSNSSSPENSLHAWDTA